MTTSTHTGRTNLLVGSVGGLHRVDDGQTDLAGQRITALAGTWAIVDRRAVWNGQEIVAEIDHLDATCLMGDADGAIVGTTEGHLLRVPGGGRIDSFDQAPGRDSWYTPWGAPADVRSLASAPDGTLFVNVHVGGILRSADGGCTWEPTLDIDLDVHQVVVAPDGTVVAASAHGLATSVDGGRSFAVSADGLHATYARAVAVAGDTVLLSVSTGPEGHRAALYLRPLHGGGTFRRSAIGLPGTFAGNIDTFCLVGDGALAALGTLAGRVYLSDDAGVTWSTAAAGPPVTCLTFAAGRATRDGTSAERAPDDDRLPRPELPGGARGITLGRPPRLPPGLPPGPRRSRP